MSNCLIEKGYVDLEDLKCKKDYPTRERMEKGPVAVIECMQEIPCNPCGKACPKDAILIAKLTDLPALDAEKCIGCGICIAKCPGQAIFVVDMSYSEKEGTVTFPYEYLPAPEKGQKVKAVGRDGEYICDGEVVKVVDTKNLNKTVLVTISVPKEHVETVRFIKRLREGE